MKKILLNLAFTNPVSTDFSFEKYFALGIFPFLIPIN